MRLLYPTPQSTFSFSSILPPFFFLLDQLKCIPKKPQDSKITHLLLFHTTYDFFGLDQLNRIAKLQDSGIFLFNFLVPSFSLISRVLTFNCSCCWFSILHIGMRMAFFYLGFRSSSYKLVELV
ncbi:hypothetical protein ACE6H2_016669 [Prunus campanulata]